MEPIKPRIEPFIIMTDPFINLATIQTHPVLLPENVTKPSSYTVKVEHDNQLGIDQEYYTPASAFDPSVPPSAETYEVVEAASLKPRF